MDDADEGTAHTSSSGSSAGIRTDGSTGGHAELPSATTTTPQQPPLPQQQQQHEQQGDALSTYNGGPVFLVTDIKSTGDAATNIATMPSAPFLYGVSIGICMSSALSEAGGAGLGTVGWHEVRETRVDGQGGGVSGDMLHRGLSKAVVQFVNHDTPWCCVSDTAAVPLPLCEPPSLTSRLCTLLGSARSSWVGGGTPPSCAVCVRRMQSCCCDMVVCACVRHLHAPCASASARQRRVR